MNKQTWQFPHTGTIPGIAGLWHAGQLVDVDTDTNTVVATRLVDVPTLEEQPVASTGEAKTSKAKEAN